MGEKLARKDSQIRKTTSRRLLKGKDVGERRKKLLDGGYIYLRPMAVFEKRIIHLHPWAK